MSSFRNGEEITLSEDEGTYELYTALGRIPTYTKIYVDNQDGYALRVLKAKRDQNGDVVLVTTSAPKTTPIIKVG